MKAAAPESAAEIDGLWERYHPKVAVVEDQSGITLDATRERIAFDPKTMDVFWLIGFSGWRAIECYSPHVSRQANVRTSPTWRSPECRSADDRRLVGHLGERQLVDGKREFVSRR